MSGPTRRRSLTAAFLGLVSVAPAAADDAGMLRGRVDSVYIGAPQAALEVVALRMGDDRRGTLVSSVEPGAEPCTWEYRFDSIPTGRYRLSLRGRPTQSASLPPPVEVDVRAGRVTQSDFGAGRVMRVGPTRALKRPSDAAAAARDGTVVEIDAETYPQDVAVWRQNDLVLRGAGGHAHLRADGQHAQGKAIWVIGGNNVRVERIAFSGAKVPDGNGAGIRHEGVDLAICDSRFHDNENGILGGGGDVLIEYSEFGHNGAGDGYTHNLYLTERTRRLILRHSYSHHARVGHLLKSRARVNFLLYNRFSDEAEGDSSYAVDLPNGGVAYLIGNLIQQGPRSQNRAIVAFAAELEQASEQDRIRVVNNTFVNDSHAGTFLIVKERAEAWIVNNLFAGPGQMLRGAAARVQANLMLREGGFVDRENYDYRPNARSRARDAGAEPGVDGEVGLRPTHQYVHPARGEPRPTAGPIDIGAYEYAP